jgi:hypothetical protein
LTTAASTRAALQEMLRVTRRGGRVGIGEPDWDTLTVSGADASLTDQILAVGKGGPASPQSIGGRLHTLFEQAEIAADVEPAVLELTDLKAAIHLFQLQSWAERAVSSQRLSVDDAARWLESLKKSGRDGRFKCSLTSYTAVGVRH